MNRLELSPSVFSILSGLIEEKVGLHYGLLDRDVLRDKASMRAMDAGFTSLLDYYYFLRYDEGSAKELSELVDTLVVNETYFFREWAPIKTITDNFIASACAEGRRPRIWSAACATGEEPLSLAMLLDSRGLLEKTEILATDICARVLEKAQTGRFGKRSVRAVPDQELCDRYLRQELDGWSIKPEMVSAVRWKYHNLVQRELYPQHGLFDVIICRNVLIYFSDATVKMILENISRSLAPGGILLVGISESLLRYGSAFAGEELDGTFIYRKSDAP